MNQFTWVPLFIISLDQITKRIALFNESIQSNIDYDFFQNKIIWNKGISFGLFAQSYYNVIVYCAIIISLALVFWTFWKSKNKFDTIAWGLIVGGGMSNLVDRWIFGAVLDFISKTLQDYSFPIFNIADVAITLGAIILGRKLISKGKSKSSKSEPKK